MQHLNLSESGAEAIYRRYQKQKAKKLAKGFENEIDDETS